MCCLRNQMHIACWHHVETGSSLEKQSSLDLLKHFGPVHLSSFFLVQPPTSNDSIPEEAQPKVQPNVIPLYCTNKVHVRFPV